LCFALSSASINLFFSILNYFDLNFFFYYCRHCKKIADIAKMESSSHKQMVEFSVLSEDQTFLNREGMMIDTHHSFLVSGPDKDGNFMIEVPCQWGPSKMWRVHSTRIKVVPPKPEMTPEQKAHEKMLAQLM
jgi:hypothetical protein